MAELLRDMIKSNREPMFDPDDRELEFYYKDHKTQLLEKAEIKYFTPDDMARYEHRPRRYLYENHYPQGADWLLCWLNDLSGPEEFKNLTKIYVPNFSQIEEMFDTYRTISTQTKIAKEELATA